MNVLITSASRKVLLLNSFKQALEQTGGGKVFAVDISPLSAALYHSDAAYLVPPSASPGFVPALQWLCREHDIKLIVPTRDEELLLLAGSTGLFEDAGVRVMVPSPDTVEICQDKRRFVDFCAARGLPTPQTYPEGEIPDKQARFPLHVKERFGKGGRNAFKVKDKAALDMALGCTAAPIIQEFRDDDEYTIDLFADFQGRVISVVPRQRILTVGGESYVAKTCKNEKLMKAAMALAGALGLIGHNTIQCFFDGQVARFIEVNPRYGGGVNLSFAAGADTPLYLVKLVKGEVVPSCIGQFTDNLIMLRHTEDTIIDESALKKVSGFDQGRNL